jgi:hypothetical protein
MNKPFIEDGYLINPQKRCIYCQALEVTDLSTKECNLKSNNDITFCNNKEECENNIVNEGNNIDISIDDESISFKDEQDNEITFFNQNKQY